jgi:DNA-binding Lrp family transcriptional regulator
MSLSEARLLSSNSKTSDLTEKILKVINEKKPQSVRQLTEVVKETSDFEKEEILESVLKMQIEGILKLEDVAPQPRTSVTRLKIGKILFSYWMTIAIGMLAAVVIFTIPEDFYPWIYARNILGVIFVVFLPGYSVIKALFPVNMPIKTSTENLEALERFALSFSMSIALVAIVGLLLNISPWGMQLDVMVLSLLAVTLIFATVAVVREIQVSKQASAYEGSS